VAVRGLSIAISYGSVYSTVALMCATVQICSGHHRNFGELVL
jgi:hypothetical protein